MPLGKSSPVRSHYNSLVVGFAEVRPPQRSFSIEARAYDDGIAFRYIIPEQTDLREIRSRAAERPDDIQPAPWLRKSFLEIVAFSA
jgi:hypothetical protein